MTKRGQKSTRKNKNKVNPLMRRGMAPPRPKLSFDGQVLNSVGYFTASATVANVAKDNFQVSGNSTFSLSRNATAMINLYSEYKFRSVTMEWIPSISPASADAGSRIHIAYIDNPEKMFQWDTLVAGPLTLAAVRNTRNVRSFNAWERFTYTVPLTCRRKLFDIDSTDAAMSIDDFDHTTQGYVIIAQESISPAVTLGTFKFSYSMELHNLSISLGT